MAVITPDGIVGKVISVYPKASQVMLVTDPAFAAGVISEKHRVHGTLKGKGYSSRDDRLRAERKGTGARRVVLTPPATIVFSPRGFRWAWPM